MMGKLIKLEIVCENSVPVQNNSKILNWMVERSVADFENGHKSLMSDLRSDLKDNFGKQNITFTSEFRHKIWMLGYKDLVFKIFSASVGGSTVEICGHTYEDMRNRKNENIIIEFLEELSNILNK